MDAKAFPTTALLRESWSPVEDLATRGVRCAAVDFRRGVRTHRQLLAFCATILLITLIQAQVTPPCGADELHAPRNSGPQSPVVHEPALLPVPIAGSRSAAPQLGAEVLVTPTCPDASAALTVRGRPFGAATRAIFGAQIANGRAAQLVLYRYDFVAGRAALAPAGQRKLTRLAPALDQTPFLLLIQPSESRPELDEARRQKVLATFELLGYPVSHERVVIARPPSRGLHGVEAHGLHMRFHELMTGSQTGQRPPVTVQP